MATQIPASRPEARTIARMGEALKHHPEIARKMANVAPEVSNYILGSFRALIRDSERVRNCTPESLIDCLGDALDFELAIGRNNEAFVIPYGKKATFQIGYGGIVALCKRGGELQRIEVYAVHEGDEFAYELGDEPKITHKPEARMKPGEIRGEITHVYAIARLTSGERKYEIWPRAKIEAHRNHFSKDYRRAEADGKKNSTWHTSFESMAKKTVVIAVCANLTKTPKMQTAIEGDELLRSFFPALPPVQTPLDAEHEPAETDTVDASDQTPSETPIELTPQTIFEGLSDPARKRLQTLDADLTEFDDILAVERCAETAKKEAGGDVDEMDRIQWLADRRAAAIRASRGERAKKKDTAAK